jgi:DNA polymerase-3 subunit beta
MNFTIEANTLKAALPRAVKAAARRSTIPILGHVQLTAQPAEDGAAALLRIATTDMDVWLAQTLPIELSEAGAVAVPADRLAAIAASAPAGGDVRFDLRGGLLQVACGAARYRLPSLPAADFPAPPEAAEVESFEIAGGALARLLGVVAPAISTEETRYYLCGACWLAVQGEGFYVGLRLVATDGCRLHYIDGPEIPAPSLPAEGALLPRASCNLVRGMLAEADPVTVATAPAHMRFEAALGAARLALTSRLIDGTFPDYQRVVAPPGEPAIEIDREALLAALRRVAPFGGVSGTAGERGTAIGLRVAGEELLVIGWAGDGALGVDRLPIAPRGAADGIEVSYLSSYLADGLEALDCPRVRLSWPLDTASPLRLEPPEPGDRLVILMPRRNVIPEIPEDG